ncbi:MAG: BON domain-containing protein [Thermogutta sp.]|uniref:BON domain-containing protein n=1 Tax=Thermogutta sp. TaxID=1962930 RepID=UPI0019AB6688|nr:BON domain-containing protein [Thermogutta sp.]MBC7351199.1 BON domain-containing protein [Thermogutta sp.]
MSVQLLSGDLEMRARLALRNSPIYELRDIDVEERDNTIVLRGVVSSFYHKQLAQEAVRSILRGHDVELLNLIEVTRDRFVDPD